MTGPVDWTIRDVVIAVTGQDKAWELIEALNANGWDLHRADGSCPTCLPSRRREDPR